YSPLLSNVGLFSSCFSILKSSAHMLVEIKLKLEATARDKAKGFNMRSISVIKILRKNECNLSAKIILRGLKNLHFIRVININGIVFSFFLNSFSSCNFYNFHTL